MLADLFISVADAVISYTINKLDPVETLKTRLKQDAAKLAFQKAFARAYSAFAHQYPEYVTSLFDQSFLTNEAVPEISKLFIGSQNPDPVLLAQAWGMSIGFDANSEFCKQVTKPSSYFLEWLEAELKKEPDLKPFFDSKSLDNQPGLETNIERPATELTQDLSNDLNQVTEHEKVIINIGGDVHGTIIIGNNNSVVTNNSSEHHPRIFQAPPLPEYFIPRPEAKDALLNQILLTSAKTGTLVVSAIQGLGGIGKTTIVSDLAHDPDMLTRYPDGVLWVTLGQQPELLGLLHAWIRALGDYKYTPLAPEDATLHLCTLLSDKTCLLVVDDAWNADHVRPFLVGSDQCQVIITTRDAALAGKVHARLFDLDVMTEAQSLALFESRLGAFGEQRPAAVALARELGYLPLALELAAAQIEGGQTWQKLQAAFHKELADLDIISFDEATHRNESLRISFKLSLNQLTQPEQISFAWLGVLPEDAQLSPQMAATFWGLTNEQAGKRLQRFRNKALLKTVGKERYAIHDLLHDEAKVRLAQELPISQAHAILLDRYNALCQAFSSGGQHVLLDSSHFTRPWHTLPDDNYIHAYLSWHLEKAGLSEEIFSLLHEETAAGRNGWYEACEQLGQTAIFVADVQRAWVLADQISQANKNSMDRNAVLTHKIRLALISVSINCLATEIPPFLFEVLVEKGIWSPVHALAYARRITNQIFLLDVVIRLAPYLPGNLLGEALEISRKIETGWDRAKALSALIPYLTPSQILDALKIARVISQEEYRIDALNALVPYLPDSRRIDALEEALAAVKKITNDQSNATVQARTYAKLAGNLPEPLLHRVLLETRKWSESSANQIMYVGFAPYLAKFGFLEEALTMTRKIENSRDQAATYLQLMPYLTEPMRDQVWNTTLVEIKRINIWEIRDAAKWMPQLPEQWQIEILSAALAVIRKEKAENNEEHRATALVKLAPQIPISLLPQALATALALPSERHRTTAVLGLVPHLTEPLLHKVLEAAREIEHEGHRAAILAELAPALNGSLRDQVLHESLEAIRKSTWEERRAEVFTKLAPHLSEPLRSEILHDALCAIQKSKEKSKSLVTAPLEKLASLLSEPLLLEAVAITKDDDGYRPEELLVLVPQFARLGLLEKALAVAQEIKNNRIKAQALVGIALCLTGHQQVQVLQDALASVSLIGDEINQAQVSAAFLPHLTKSLRTQAFTKVSSLTNSRDKINLLVKMAPYLPGDLSAQALHEAWSAARGIQSNYEKKYVLINLAPHLPEAYIPNVLAEALKTTEQPSRFEIEKEIFGNFLPYLSDVHKIDLLASIQSLDNNSLREWKLIVLLPYLPAAIQTKIASAELIGKQSQLQPADTIRVGIYLPEPARTEVCRQALQNIFLMIEKKYMFLGTSMYGDVMLTDLIRLLPETLKTEVVAQIIAAIRGAGPIYQSLQNESSDSKARLLIQLVPHIPEDMKAGVIGDALAMVKTIPLHSTGHIDVAKLLIDLIPHLPDDRIEETLDLVSRLHSAVGVENEVYSVPLASTWLELLPCLPEHLKEKALKAIQAIWDPGVEARVLAGFAPYLPEGLMSDAWAATQRITKPIDRTEVLIALSSVLPRVLQTDAWQETLVTIQAITDQSSRASAIANFVPQRPEAIYHDKTEEVCLGVIKEMSFQSRKDLFDGLKILTPVIFALGGEEAIAETYRAITDVTRWWP